MPTLSAQISALLYKMYLVACLIESESKTKKVFILYDYCDILDFNKRNLGMTFESLSQPKKYQYQFSRKCCYRPRKLIYDSAKFIDHCFRLIIKGYQFNTVIKIFFQYFLLM